MVKIGMMIGDRYEVLEKIGTGGMSDVYKAKDHKLNRFVAVKVLKQEFAENANFVSKFKIEAQAAAGLMHPNVVNVYDVGEENDINYIVMELVEGITLKKYIEKKARLSVKESVTIAIQIALGIEAAHNNHIIHRDIKPQNVIISKEGKVKVTDFGIAKAATSNTITSNVMGSVHYTSPEQARGGYSDEKSDIYSLGISLFEMLTGRVPFNGETTVAIAIKQIQEEMPSPREFVDDIPISVEQIVLKCTQKSPDRRYQNMGQLIDDLKRSFISPDEDYVKISEFDAQGATRAVSKEEMDRIKESSVEKQDSVTGELPQVNPNSKDDNDLEYNSKMEKITTILAIVVGIIIFAVAILLLGKTVGIFKLSKDNKGKVSISDTVYEKTEQIVMPGVTLMEYTKAMDILESNGLKSRITWQESDEYELGIVINSSAKEGLKVDLGSEVVLTVSSGTSSVLVPEVVGFTLNAANKAIVSAGFTANITEDWSEDIPEGVIISQDPLGEDKAPDGSTITIVVSKGPAKDLAVVPSLLGKTEAEALQILSSKGFTEGEVSEIYNEIYGEGYICYQSPAGGLEAEAGSSVDFFISKGVEPDDDEIRYCYSENILAPSSGEDPDYTSGTNVHIVITDTNGYVWYDYITTSFPVGVNIWNMTSSEKGFITLTYNVKVAGTQVVDEETGETIFKEGSVEEHTITREIEFAVDGH